MTPAAHSATTADDWEVVRRSSFFERLPEPIVRDLTQGQPIRACERREELCAQGAAADFCFIVVDGLLAMTRRADAQDDDEAAGEAAVIGVHGPGAGLMLAEGLTQGRYPATLTAVGPARVMRLDAARLRQRIESDGALAMKMLAAASMHLRALVLHIAELKTMTGPARLAHLVLDLSGARAGRAEVILPYEKQLLAHRLGVTPESLSRAMAQLKRHGVVVHRDRLIVRDVARLRAAAQAMNAA
ncbi:MAG: Crp/Fnr family transcriptional regulator [Rhizobiales bacterium]|nr:Crp/Fnr family transcriptional regulator [Hyphomicrobiales bacterium]